MTPGQWAVIVILGYFVISTIWFVVLARVDKWEYWPLAIPAGLLFGAVTTIVLAIIGWGIWGLTLLWNS